MPEFSGEIWTATPGFDQTVDICSTRLLLKGKPMVLDVPCGKGEALRRLRRRHKIVGVGVDYSDRYIALARDETERAGLRSITFQQGDGACLAFGDGVFDICLSIGGPLCVSPDPSAFEAPDMPALLGNLREQARVVRKGG